MKVALAGTAEAWHNYAACRFLVYEDFNSSFECFLLAFKMDPMNKRLKSNFDVMMAHFHGNDQSKLAGIVRDRMVEIARIDAEKQNAKLQRQAEAKIRAIMATKIKVRYPFNFMTCIIFFHKQRWYKLRKWMREKYSVDA